MSAKSGSPAADKFSRLMNTVEDLHPDLARCVRRATRIGDVLHHPLIVQTFYTPQLNAVLNEGYRQKVAALEESLALKEWYSYVFLHERPYRWEAFARVAEKIESDQDYWHLLGHVWRDSENIHEVRDLVGVLVGVPRPGRAEHLTDENGRKLYAALPDEFKIYRGYVPPGDRFGLSWTVSPTVAAFFARRFGKLGSVVTATCRKRDVIAVLCGRGESEIVVDPADLPVIRTLARPRLGPQLRRLRDAAAGVFKLSPSRSYHGPSHWDQVYRNGLELCRRTPDANQVVVSCFALVHDCMREDEGSDPHHGRRAAEFCGKLRGDVLAFLSTDEYLTLKIAVMYHNDGKTTTDPTVGACWDADRLDLPRVGVVPDPAKLSTAAAKDLILKV